MYKKCHKSEISINTGNKKQRKQSKEHLPHCTKYLGFKPNLIDLIHNHNRASLVNFNTKEKISSLAKTKAIAQFGVPHNGCRNIKKKLANRGTHIALPAFIMRSFHLSHPPS